MKVCDTMKMLLPLYNSNDLDPAEKDRVHEHVSHCADCSRALHEFEAIGSAIKRVDLVPDENYGSYLVTRIHQKLDKRQSTMRWLWKTVPAFGTLAVVFSLFVLPGNGRFDNDLFYSELAMLSQMTHSGYLTSTSQLDYYMKDNSDISLTNQDYTAKAEDYILNQADAASDEYYNLLLNEMDDASFKSTVENLKNMKL